MEFELLSPGLEPVAKKAAAYHAKKKYKVAPEKPLWDGALYRTTLVCKKKYETVLVEVRESITLEKYFVEFIDQCLIEQIQVKIYIAVEDDGELSIPIETDKQLKAKGVGILSVSEANVDELLKAVDCSMRVRLDTTSTGIYRHRLEEFEKKYNRGDFVDALRDMSELFEGAVTALLKKSSRKGHRMQSEEDIDRMDLEKKINYLAAPAHNGVPQRRIISNDEKNDLLSFKGARNMSHHPRDARKERELQAQANERMLAGCRLIKLIYSRSNKMR